MDIQLKKGLLDVCVLATLNEGDSYGYKIVSSVSSCIEVSESTLYPILKRLESASFVTTYSVEHNGRLRKYYKITDTGREKINSFLEDWIQLTGVHDYVYERAGERA